MDCGTMKKFAFVIIWFWYLLLTGCSSVVKEVDFTQINDTGTVSVSAKWTVKEEPIETVVEDIVEILNDWSTTWAINNETGSVESLSAMQK